jgi:arylsulfatase A-like enzyme
VVFWKLAVGLFVAGLLLGGTSFAAAPAKRPNVLFIAVDDLRPELHCYGVADMKTPNIDRLAASGVLFERQYVQFAVCIPSRVALLTSLRSERTHQVYGPHVWEKVPGAQPLGKTFGAAGYATVSLGKIWHSEGRPPSDKFDVFWQPGVGRVGDYADPKNMKLLLETLNNKKPQKGAGKKKAGAAKLPPIVECVDAPDNVYRDGMIADRAISEMRRLKDGPKPFMLAVGFHKPHVPFVAPKRCWDLYDRLQREHEFPHLRLRSV